MVSKDTLGIFVVFSLLGVCLTIVLIAEWADKESTPPITKVQVHNQAELNFHVIGDFAQFDSSKLIEGKEPVQLVAEQMKELALYNPIQMIVSTGDNRYPYSNSAFDQVIYRYLYRTFNLPGLSHKPWYLVLGNHDCREDPSYEVDANNLYPAWNMPSPYFNFSVNVDQGKVGFVFMDGCNLYKENRITQKDKQQLDWADETLNYYNSNPEYLWKIVNIHMPVFSASDHGDNQNLKKYLYPILQKHSVDVVLSGHEHCMEHLASQNSTLTPKPKCRGSKITTEYLKSKNSTSWTKGQAIHQVVQGAGGKELYKLCPTKVTSMAQLYFGYCNYGFSQVTINSKLLRVDYYLYNSSEPVYSFKITN